MATDPVKQVQERVYPTDIQAELAERLRALAELPPAPETPYLTASLDWRPEGSDPQYRGGQQRFAHEARRIKDQYGPRGPSFESLSTDIERIEAYFKEERDPEPQGLFIVANSGQGVFEAVPVDLPLETRISSGPIPALSPLARLDEDNPTYAVMIADQQSSSISVIARRQRVEALDISSSDYPRKQQSGGWSQQRFQQRADERVMALMREIADATEEFLGDRGIDLLILAGDQTLIGQFDEAASERLQSFVIGTVALDNEANEQEMIDATFSIAEEAERKRESAAVDQVQERLNSGGAVVSGGPAVLGALVNGQVELLVMNEDFHADGWADFQNLRYGAGEFPDVFGTGDTEIDATPIDVEEELVRLAIQTSAGIEIIHTGVPADYETAEDVPDAGEQMPRAEAATVLDSLGGVAAILRYEIRE